LPYSPHERHYKQLQALNASVNEALLRTDYDALAPIVRDQKDIMQALEAAGDCQELSLLGLITEIKNQMDETAITLQAHRDGLAAQMETAGKKDKLLRAYGK